MLTANSNTNTASAKSLKYAIDCIDNLIEAAAEVAAVFHTYQVIVEDSDLPSDTQIIEECSQMFTVMNRMLLKDKANLQHAYMMKKAMAKSDKLLKEIRKPKSEKQNQSVAVA